MLFRSVLSSLDRYRHEIVGRGSVLGPLLFILYTTPLRKVISDSSSSHKLYPDDTQLYISFSAADFSHNIAHLEQTVSNVGLGDTRNFSHDMYRGKISRYSIYRDTIY